MNTFIALFRGINVGGHNILPMRELVAVLEGLGLQNIRTYIQSGNVVLDSRGSDGVALAKKIREGVHRSHGFAPEVMLLKSGEFGNAIKSNPYAHAESEPKTLHLFFLGTKPKKPDMKKLEDLQRDNERFALKGKVFYLHAPDGIGRSKLAASVEKALGVNVTARNWRSVCKIAEMAKG